MTKALKSISRGGCLDMASLAARRVLRACNGFATGFRAGFPGSRESDSGSDRGGAE